MQEKTDTAAATVITTEFNMEDHVTENKDTSFPAAFDDWTDEVSSGNRFLSVVKLLLIMFSYGFTFFTMIRLGFWMASTPEYADSEFIHVTDWLTDIYSSGKWADPTFIKAFIDFGLLFLFGLQHSLFSSRYLKDHMMSFWYFLRHEYNIYKPLYTVTTGLALQILIKFWQPIPVYLWNYGFLIEQDLFVWVHICAWTILYGTSLMLDLPAMIGLTQVIIQSPTLTAKSPELQRMYQRQRHMGLVPFIFILVVHPLGSLDRLILAVCVVYYTCRQWKSESCYEYAKSMKGVKTYRLSY